MQTKQKITEGRKHFGMEHTAFSVSLTERRCANTLTSWPIKTHIVVSMSEHHPKCKSTMLDVSVQVVSLEVQEENHVSLACFSPSSQGGHLHAEYQHTRFTLHVII